MARAGEAVTSYEPSGVWYCRKHGGTVNEDEHHDAEDVCPWSDTRYDKDGTPLDLCDWTELVYEKAKVDD